MTRRLLTDAERDERRRRSFSDEAYRHYDASRGFGSRAEWEAAAERLAQGRGAYRRGGFAEAPSDLTILGLAAMPADIDGLRSAFRAQAKRTHPDTGGDPMAFKAVYAAYERLVRHY